MVCLFAKAEAWAHPDLGLQISPGVEPVLLEPWESLEETLLTRWAAQRVSRAALPQLLAPLLKSRSNGKKPLLSVVLVVGSTGSGLGCLGSNPGSVLQEL